MSAKEQIGVTALLLAEKTNTIKRLCSRKPFRLVLLLIILVAGTALWISRSRRMEREQQCRLIAPTIIAMDRAPPTRIYGDRELQREVCSMMTCPISRDIISMVLRLRLYKKLSTQITMSNNVKKVDIFDEELIAALHQGLFYWTRTPNNNIRELTREHAQTRRGIVITTGMNTLAMTIHIIQTIRRVYRSQMPIEIIYDGRKDLTAKAVAFLSKLPQVSCINFQSVFDLRGLKLEGWDLKPFAMLASTFPEVMLLDADAVLMQRPEFFFDLAQYERSGALFFKDRIMYLRPFNFSHWFNTLLPRPHSSTLRASEMYRGLTNYQQESGMVIIDKTRGLFGLLAACLLNFPKPKASLHAATWGEKEAFWIGYEMAEEPYEFSNGKNGAIGKAMLTQPDQFSGKLAHFDATDRLLWFNDGIIEEKRISTTPTANLTHVAFNGHWYYLTMQNATVYSLDSKTLERLEDIKKVWNSNPLSL